MKKKLLIAAAAVLTTAAVTATVLNTGQKKEIKKAKKECVYKTHCPKAMKSTCF